MKSILDPSFRYTSSFNTDLQKTFAKIRRVRLDLAGRAPPLAAAATIGSIAKKTATGR